MKNESKQSQVGAKVKVGNREGTIVESRADKHHVKFKDSMILKPTDWYENKELKRFW